MSEDEAVRVAEILVTADGECHICAADLVNLFCREFPNHADAARSTYLEHWPGRTDLLAEDAP